MQDFLQTLVGGLSLGAIYALVALGFSLVYRTMGLVNFAHADVVTIGAYVASTFSMSARLPFVAAMAVAIVTTGLIGVVIERVLRPLENKDFDLMLIGTIGFGIVLVLGVGVAAVALLALFLQRTKRGAAMQAVAMDHEAAAAVGIHVGRSNAIAFSIGAGLAALAGGLAGPLLYVNPTMGASLGIKGFAGAILGGFGSIPGAIVGGPAIGILDAFAAGRFQGYSDLVTFVVFAVLIMIRPTGIFGERTVNRA